LARLAATAAAAAAADAAAGEDVGWRRELARRIGMLARRAARCLAL